MQKIYIGIGVVVLAGGVLIGVFWNKAGNKTDGESNAVKSEQNQKTAINQEKDAVNSGGLYTINELLTMNKPMKCSWKESNTDKAEVTNIIYVNGKKFYQDVTMGDVGHAYTISDNEYLYIWNDFTGAASKMKISEVNAGAEPVQGAKKDTAGLDQKRDFICENWSADNSIFNPPQDKEFKDVTEEMKQVTQELQGGGLEKAKQQMCDLCKQAPTQELRDECKKNAECSE